MSDFTFLPPKYDPEKAERCACNTFDWLRCAESWLNVSDNKEQALRCASRAADYAKTCPDWYFCCDFWLDIIPDRDNAKRCLLQAESMEDVAEYQFTGHCEYWLKIGDTERARASLERVPEEKEVMIVSYWTSLADLWQLKFGERDKATDAMLEAEKIATSFLDWMDCAYCWERIGGREERNRCLSVASQM
jgi:hypothetical protein